MYKNGYLKVEAVTPRIIVGDLENNRKEIISALDRSRASIVVFPELSLSGYTASDMFFQQDFIASIEKSLAIIMEKTTFKGIYILGVPIDFYGNFFNCAVVIKEKRILGVVPKHYIPNSKEFYEKRWFNSGYKMKTRSIRLFDQDVPFGYLIFQEENKNIRFGVEVCQDLWATYSPSDDMSLAGANLIFNLSASTEYLGKRSQRRAAVIDHSRKQISAYVYTSSGYFESSSEVVYSPHKLVASLGQMVAEDSSYYRETSALVVDLDIDAINFQKRQDSTYRDMHKAVQDEYETVFFELEDNDNYAFERPLNPQPFLPEKEEEKELDLVNELQVHALMKRLESLPKGVDRIILGVSGGLDSTLALIVSHQAMERMGRDVKDIIGVTMPARVTSKETKTRALKLMEKLGITALEIPIHAMLEEHLDRIEHDAKDVTYENAQARIRTLTLMDLSNKYQGFVLGTGDLSEIALGWMTYNGDHMSMYAINSGIPKTWVRELVGYHATRTYSHLSDLFDEILQAPVSPELIEDQDTEREIGNYEINDFILYHHLLNGAGERKIAWLLENAFRLDKQRIETYVDRFFKRFYTQQFKRQTLPEGPKLLSVSLSPRGEYRMPGDVIRKRRYP
ncbi:MAG: NAD(+) synthase [Acholeplasmataceae bacterium]